MKGSIMLRLNIDQIPEVGLDLEGEESPKSFPVLSEMIAAGECEFTSPINTALRVIPIDDMIEVEGVLNTSVRLHCGRCLEAFETALKSRFAITYLQPEAGIEIDTDQKEVELSVEEMNLIYFQGEEINLREAIQEQVVLAFPLKAICKTNCKGLCPNCGVNLNLGDCGCDQKPLDAKFAALKELNVDKK